MRERDATTTAARAVMLARDPTATDQTLPSRMDEAVARAVLRVEHDRLRNQIEALRGSEPFSTRESARALDDVLALLGESTQEPRG